MLSKTCPICGATKGPEAFYVDRRRSNGLYTYCKECCKTKAKRDYQLADKERRNRKHREWVQRNKERVAFQKAKSAYRLTYEEFAQLAKVCVICGGRTKLVIDHSHQTGRVRGRLCRTCNTGLGMFADNPALLDRAANYLLGYASPDIFAQTYEKVED